MTDPLREEVTAIPCHEQTGAKKIRMEERGSGERALGAKNYRANGPLPSLFRFGTFVFFS